MKKLITIFNLLILTFITSIIANTCYADAAMTMGTFTPAKLIFNQNKNAITISNRTGVYMYVHVMVEDGSLTMSSDEDDCDKLTLSTSSHLNSMVCFLRNNEDLHLMNNDASKTYAQGSYQIMLEESYAWGASKHATTKKKT